MLLRDPQLELLDIEPTIRDGQMPLTNKFFHKLETDFVAEPWDVPIGPAKTPMQMEKKRLITFKTPISRQQLRVSTTETPTNISRPKSCHHQKSVFVDLGVPPQQPTYQKVVQRIVISAQNKSSRKNSTSQYRQMCLKKILLAQKQNSQLCTHTSSDYFNFIQSINPVSQKNKTTPELKKFKLKLKNILS